MFWPMARLKKILFSTRTMTVLLLLYGVSMAIATFVEKDYDTNTAKALIYNSRWFEILMLWLVVLFIANIKTYRLTRKEKWPVLVFHLAFIFMFIGGAVTRYISFEGQMPIKQGQTTNEIISDLTYFKLNVNDGTGSLVFDKYPYMMSYFNAKNTRWPFKRTFQQEYQFGDKIISLKTLDYIPLAKDSIQLTESGKKMIDVVSIGQGGRENNYIEEGKVKSIDGLVFSYNNPVQGAIQLSGKDGNILITSPFDGQAMSMEGQQIGVVIDSAQLIRNISKIRPNETVPLNHRTLYTIKNTTFVIPGNSFRGNIVYYTGDKNSMTDKSLWDVVQLELSSGGEKDTLIINGGKGFTDYSKTVRINGMNVSLGFGSKILHTDFYLRCDNFTLERYPGSANPSSYESKITVIDNGNQNQHRIYMNNVMDYQGYRFFQSSYFPDESGTILSVNADRWGTYITYFGYFLLFTGMFFTLFWKGTRFRKLNDSLKKMHSGTLIFALLLFLGLGLRTTNGFAQYKQVVSKEDSMAAIQQEMIRTSQFASRDQLAMNRIIDPVHAARFGHLLVQNFQGRIEPMDTYTLELLRKISKKDRYLKGDVSLSPEQWFISMQVDPGNWVNEPMIEVSKKGGDELMKETGANPDGFTSYINLVDPNTGMYKLGNQVNQSFSKRKADQSNYDKELINVTERFNIFSSLIYGYYTRVIPVKNDPAQTWRSWIYFGQGNNDSSRIDTVAYTFLSAYFDGIKKGLQTGNWSDADKRLDEISNYQQVWGQKISPSKSKVDLEILYNHMNVFFWLMIVYSLLGMVMTALGFAEVFSSESRYHRMIRIPTKGFLGIMIAALSLHGLALGVRWYLSGHAPWSNGYEAIVFISGIGVLSGLLLYKNRNAFIPAAGALVATIMMGFAHGGSMLDPQITPLEPVLKSYWLMIHVGIITSSYGFFGLSAVLSALSLVLFSARPTKKIEHSIRELTIVNEMSLTIGIFALIVGTFLGGMWANESWGRYWSWDPKETWAFISVIFYAVVLHLRLVPKLGTRLTFNLASFWAIWSVIFTYFGVNYYLVGLHSYAAGAPMPIPAWVYITLAGMFGLSVLAWFRNRLNKKRYPLMKA